MDKTNYPRFEDVFPGETPITITQLATSLDRPVVVLQRWAKEKRFRNMIGKYREGRARILVPRSEVPKIDAMPKGKGSSPQKPWKTRVARLAREGKITFLTEHQQIEATDRVPNQQIENPDGSITIQTLERPKFTDE